MSFAQKNISALLTKQYFGEQVINKINTKNNSAINQELLGKVGNYLKSDTQDYLSSFDFNLHMNIILFGFTNITLVEEIVKNMSPLSTLTVFEKEVDLLLYTFGVRDVSHLLSDSRVVLLTGDKEDVRKYINIRVATRDYSYNLPRIKVVSVKYSFELDKNYVNDIFYHLINETKYIASTLGNDINDMLEGFDHSIENWPNLIRSIGVNDLKDKYKDVPAIIVSAGPSLDKNIEYLKEAFGKALILSVDTTLKKVLDLGIIPDSVSTIERPKNMYSIFYKGVEKPDETVFIGPSVVTKKIIDDFERFIFTGRRGEPPVRAVADALDYDSLEIGMSCAHIPFAFADYVGANPIIFIGQDLAFSKEGHTHFGEASEVTKEGATKLEYVEVEDNEGNKILTNKIYYQFLLWFQNQIAQIKDKTIINATEGGAKIEGTISMMFKDVVEQYCKNSIKPLWDIYDEVHSDQNNNQNEKIDKVKQFLEALITDAESVSKEVVKNIDKIVKFQGPAHSTIQNFYDMRKEVDLLLNQNFVLNFLMQTITIKYNRSFNNYPCHINMKEWEMLKAEGTRYYQLIQQVLNTLKVKFEKYLSEIESYDIDTLDS